MHELIKIKTPIWKTLSVGIAEDKLNGYNEIRVKILYKDKKGNTMFPGIFAMDTAKAKTYPTMVVGQGRIVHVIPIRDFNRSQV